MHPYTDGELIKTNTPPPPLLALYIALVDFTDLEEADPANFIEAAGGQRHGVHLFPRQGEGGVV